jgi:glycosyltransferase involved in cell wall biosynthesis
MACGLPVVATAVPGVAEIMGDEAPLPGIIAPIADVSALASALGKLLDDVGLAQELGFRAKKRTQDFSVVSVGTQLRSFLLAHANA